MTTDPTIYDVPTPQEVQEDRLAYQREMEKKTSAREAARILLPMFLDGYFENCGDDIAQDAVDAGADAYGVIENWLRGVAGEFKAPQIVMSENLCSDCPPVGYPTDETRCALCPRRLAMTDLRWHTCTAGDPWRPALGKRGLHPDAVEVGEQTSAFPGGDKQNMFCPHCKTQWLQELPQ